MNVEKIRAWLLYAPFIVFGLLIPVNFGGHLWIYPLVGIDESTGVGISAVLIGLGLLLGLAGVFFSRQKHWYWRAMIAPFYIPTTGMSLIMSGM